MEETLYKTMFGYLCSTARSTLLFFVVAVVDSSTYVTGKNRMVRDCILQTESWQIG